MARTRSIKPGFFTNEILGALPPQDRLLFAGLWCIADKEGRLEDRPLRIRGELFPYDHEIDIEASLLRLVTHQFIHRYVTGNSRYIQVTNFKKHQSPHHTEKSSVIPAPLINGALTVEIPPSTLPPLLPSTLPPDTPEPVMTPALDEQFQEYRRLFEIVGNPIPEDFANGSFCWRSWTILDYDQRSLAVSSLAERHAAGVNVLHSPANYLQKLEYKRPLRKPTNGNGSLSRHDQIRKAMEEA